MICCVRAELEAAQFLQISEVLAGKNPYRE